ncbi:unnamed protein product [Alopecurus aequalis]
MAQRPDNFPHSHNFPDSQVINAVSFFEHVKARFAENVYQDVLSVLGGYSTGETPDAREVIDRVYELLQGQPDLLRRFDTFLPAPEPARAPTRPRRERRPTDYDADTHEILEYFKLVRHTAGERLHKRLLGLLIQLETEKALDANQIYERARQVFGSAHSELLDEFAKYLPVPTGRERDHLLRRRAKKEPSPEEHRAPAPKRKTVSLAADNPGAAKRPRADDRKTTNRRANSPAAAAVDADTKSHGVSPSRARWEFETTYTKLAGTIKRTEELLKEYEPTKEDVLPVPPRGGRGFEELFPDRDCQEVLREMYQDMLAPIRDALEDGARTELALRRIQRRLGMLEQVGVKIFMERRDRPRVEGRMLKLAVDQVKYLRKQGGQKKETDCPCVIAVTGPYVRAPVRPARREVDQPTVVRC